MIPIGGEHYPQKHVMTVIEFHYQASEAELARERTHGPRYPRMNSSGEDPSSAVATPAPSDGALEEGEPEGLPVADDPTDPESALNDVT